MTTSTAKKDEVPPGAIDGWLLRLFDGSSEALAGAREVDAHFSRIAEDFLRERATDSGVTVRSLIERFGGSELPERPMPPANYLDTLARDVVAHSTNTSSPRFIGHMTSALPHFTRSLGKLLTALNQNVVKLETAKALSPFEREALAMLHRLVYGLPESFYRTHAQDRGSTLGMVTSGGTVANITALWCARNASLGPRDGFEGVEKEGLPAALEAHGRSGAVIIGSALMHYSLEKAADLLGIGARGLIKVPVDGTGRVDLAALRQAVADSQARNQHILAIVGVAGTTDCGAVDPLPELAGIARQAGTSLHVDAAWGGAHLFSRRHRHKLDGIELADSVTIDGHKQLYLPMGIGMLVLRDPSRARVIEKRARYIIRPGSLDLGRRSLEGSRPAMSLYLHTALHLIGRAGYEQLVDKGIYNTQYLANAIRARPEFELLLEPQLNILNYRYVPAPLREAVARGGLGEAENRLISQANERLQKLQRQTGRSFVSRTTIEAPRHPHGGPVVALRVVLANPLTTEEDLHAVLDDQVHLAAQL